MVAHNWNLVGESLVRSDTSEPWQPDTGDSDVMLVVTRPGGHWERERERQQHYGGSWDLCSIPGWWRQVSWWSVLDMPTPALLVTCYHLLQHPPAGLPPPHGLTGPAGEKLPLEVSAQMPRALPWENLAMNGIAEDSLSGQWTLDAGDQRWEVETRDKCLVKKIKSNCEQFTTKLLSFVCPSKDGWCTACI